MRRLLAALVACLCLAAAPAAAVDLEGSWYVLVHYQDSETNNPEAWRWEDRLWRFTRKGDRLEWTDWPIVVLTDESGRFEAQRGGRAARVLEAWEPTPGQLADIRSGVQVNSRGSKTKTLRAGADATSWRSGGGGGADSALVITYSENWSIEGLPDAPVFVRADTLGGATAETMEGRTEYRTEAVRDGGQELVGSFDRDGSRKGRFRMIRSGGAEAIQTAAKDQKELQRKAGLRTLASSDEMRQLVRDRVEEAAADSGLTLSEDDLDALTMQAAQALARGESPDQLAPELEHSAEQRFFDFAQKGSVHDATVRYRFPFDPSVPRELSQGVGGDLAIGPMASFSTSRFSHKEPFEQAFDFRMPVGTPVLAAREGKVVRVVDHFTKGGRSRSLASRANVVIVLHDDGSFASYVHLSPGAAVEVGQRVAAGDLLGQSGSTGYSTGPHLHFDVQRLDDDGRREAVEIRFDDGSARGVVPVAGQYYGGQGAAKPPATE